MNLVEPTEEELRVYLDPQADYHPVAFESPIEMLNIIFPPLKSGEKQLYKWQHDQLLELTHGYKCSVKEPFRIIISANNGAGKDSFINAPWAIFQCMCKIRSRTVITTASHTQLVNQTEAYIRTLASLANKFFEENGICPRMFIIKKEHIVCTQTGSEIIMFVTDDPGRAEGYHPFPDYPSGEVTIIINEAKTVPDIIFDSLSRCTYTRWIEISSPGKTSGKHYIHYRAALQSPELYDPNYFYARRITSYDCPEHISKIKIESDKIEHGENSALFRSKHLALFTSLDEQVVITRENIEQALLFPPPKINLGIGRRAGLDLAGGGDENTLYVFDENEYVGHEVFKAKDTASVTVPVLLDFFKKYNLLADHIYADDGGIGQAIINQLYQAGWHINRVLMQSPPSSKGSYGNRGAELWFRFAQFADKIIYPSQDNKLISQLTSRYYTQHKTQGKLILEAKKEARAKGHGSPDRADAVVLAFTGVTMHDFIDNFGKQLSTTTRRILTQMSAIESSPGGRKRLTLPDDYPREESSTKGRMNFSNPAILLRNLYKG